MVIDIFSKKMVVTHGGSASHVRNEVSVSHNLCARIFCNVAGYFIVFMGLELVGDRLLKDHILNAVGSRNDGSMCFE